MERRRRGQLHQRPRATQLCCPCVMEGARIQQRIRSAVLQFVSTDPLRHCTHTWPLWNASRLCSPKQHPLGRFDHRACMCMWKTQVLAAEQAVMNIAPLPVLPDVLGWPHGSWATPLALAPAPAAARLP